MSSMPVHSHKILSHILNYGIFSRSSNNIVRPNIEKYSGVQAAPFWYVSQHRVVEGRAIASNVCSKYLSSLVFQFKNLPIQSSLCQSSCPHPDYGVFWSSGLPPLPAGEGRVRVFVTAPSILVNKTTRLSNLDAIALVINLWDEQLTQ